MSRLHLSKPQLKQLIVFVVERQTIWHRRYVERTPKPWTEDPILQTYKFCNVFRELDAVTIWIDKHIRKPYKDHPHLWFMLCAARQINWPDTMQELMDERAWPGAMQVENYNAAKLRKAMLARQERGDKLYTGAYMISGQRANPDRTTQDKAYLTAYLTLQPLWLDRKGIAPSLMGATLEQAHNILMEYNGFGSFLAAQVVADLKHTRYLRRADDWVAWCAPGPGSTRGLNRLYNRRREEGVKGKPLNKPWAQDEFLGAMFQVRLHLQQALYEADLLTGDRKDVLCAQDAQNCLCEWDKYERVRLGEGRPRALFAGV